ncbi:MAG: hypothetical protein QM733_02295 [Ilumatobacteraceae bacterium]
MNALLAISWEPELRGILIVIIAGTVLMGSVYLILATNMGARLGFLVALAALAGWFFLMGCVWWTYGKGLLGPAAAWKPVADVTVLQTTTAMYDANVLTTRVPEGSGTPQQVADQVDAHLVEQSWVKLLPSVPSFQQAGAAATTMLEESGAFEAGEFQVVNVFDRGGERSPQLFGGSVDFLAFWHKPHYALVEVVPLVPQRTEPGRAPAKAVVDTTQPHQYVYMIRDLGALREPAGFITVGSFLVFVVLCYMLHTRDKVVVENKARKAIPAETSV